MTGFVIAQTAVDEEAPWPRVRITNGHTVTLHLPQVERRTSNWFSPPAAVEVKPPRAKEELIGVIWFEAQGRVDCPSGPSHRPTAMNEATRTFKQCPPR
jgi:hypothetical protein